MALTQSELQALLGRQLTTNEVTNLALYNELAKDAIEQLLCTSLDSVTEARTFTPRQGYSTIFTDIFTDVQSVVVDGETLPATEYSLRQWDKHTGTWYNSIVLHNQTSEDVTITADWGFKTTPTNKLPKDLQKLLANAFNGVSASNKAQKRSGVKSKKIEDFSVTYSDMSSESQFALDNSATIRRYSLCHIPIVRNGKTGC